MATSLHNILPLNSLAGQAREGIMEMKIFAVSAAAAVLAAALVLGAGVHRPAAPYHVER